MAEESSQTQSGKVLTDELQCVQCGYALRGLEPSGSCPECGLAIKSTIDRLHSLSSRQLFTILLRLFAITVVIAPILGDFGLVYSLTYMFAHSEFAGRPIGSDSWAEMFMPFIASAAIAGLLWYFAPILACLAVPTSAPLIANIGGAKTAIIIGLAFVAAWLVATGVEELVMIGFHYATGVYGLENDQGDLSEYLAGWVAASFFRVLAGGFLFAWIIRRWDHLQ
ncbi:MAG: hypothetical protein AAGB26_03610 [Planctomycetota bacterium]